MPSDMHWAPEVMFLANVLFGLTSPGLSLL